MNQDRLEALALEVQQKDTEIRRLSAQVGNLEFQNAEYSQIVKELSDRLNCTRRSTVRFSDPLESKVGQSKHDCVPATTELDVFVVQYAHVQPTSVLQQHVLGLHGTYGYPLIVW
jgi:hypothetical protein